MGGHAPDEQVAELESGAAVAAGDGGRDAGGGVAELRYPQLEYVRDLPGVDGRQRQRLRPPCDDGGDLVAAGRHPGRRELPEDGDESRIQADFLAGLPQRRGDGGFAGFRAAAGEGDLSGVRSQSPGAFGEQDGRVWLVGEQDQDGGRARVVGGATELAERPGRAVAQRRRQA